MRARANARQSMPAERGRPEQRTREVFYEFHRKPPDKNLKRNVHRQDKGMSPNFLFCGFMY
jgi:hypothetical protein